jgi:hypothetical protein
MSSIGVPKITKRSLERKEEEHWKIIKGVKGGKEMGRTV